MKKQLKLNEEQLQALKEEFKGILLSVDRPGISSLSAWIETETDFFTAPASTQFHAAFEGGLVAHSLSVYRLLKNFCKKLNDIPEETLVIVGLLHDLCKANFFKKQMKNVKNKETNRWEEEEVYVIEDQCPMGHGEKSVYLIMQHIRLTEEEAIAIRWHMGGYDDASRAYIGGRTQSSAYDRYPLAAAVNIADMYSTHIEQL